MFEFVKFRAIEGVETRVSIVVLGTIVGQVALGKNGTRIVTMAGCKPSEPMTAEVWETKCSELDAVAKAAKAEASAKTTREWKPIPCPDCEETGRFLGPVHPVTGFRADRGPCYRCEGTGTQSPARQRANYGYDNFGPRAEAVKAAVAAAAPGI